jgi:hemoglobin
VGSLAFPLFKNWYNLSAYFRSRPFINNKMDKADISSRDDIASLVRSFYEKVKKNEKIGYIFNDVAKIDWEHHLPIMYDFWENVVFSTGNYKRNAIAAHKKLNQLEPLNKDHFAEWLRLWTATVDELFSGDNAELIKQRATSIATVMQISIFQGGISTREK